MELLQLRYFLVTAKYEHMTKAAKALQIAQPALSQSIKRLETELHVSLFDRDKRTIRLNENGKYLEKQLTPLLAALDEIPAAVQAKAHQTEHTIHLNLLAASGLITNCIIAYRALHPEIRFRLWQNPDVEQEALCISTAYPEETKNENSRVILRESFYLAVPIRSIHALQPTIRLEDVKEESFIALSNNRPIRGLCERFCLEAGFTPNISCETDSTESIRALIAAGLGISFWPERSWGPLNTAQATLIPIKSPVCQRDIILTCPPDKREETAVEDFCSFLSDYTATLK